MSPHESLHNSSTRHDGRHKPQGTAGQMDGEFMDHDPSQFESLHPQDDAALQALVNAHFRIDEVDATHRPIAQGITNLLSLLDRGHSTNIRNDSTLTDLTMARIAQARRHSPTTPAELSLTGDDDDALEALVASGFDIDHVPGSLRYRAKRVANLLGLLDIPVAGSLDTVGATNSLVSRTLSRVQRAVDEHEDRLTLSVIGSDTLEGDARRGWALRPADLMSAAALLFIGVMLVAPMATGVRAYNRDQACASNMHAAGVAFGAYAGDFQSRLPIASIAKAGTPWWNVGRVEQSNSANLFTLARANYTSNLECLSCAGNPEAPAKAGSDWVDWRTLGEVSYSYQCQFADRRANWGSGSRVVVLADASPVVRRAIRREVILPFENSLNHDGRGQNVLFNDGSSTWLSTPNLPQGRGDNIWLPRNIEAEIARMQRTAMTDPIEGTEEPEREDDSFVGP